MRLKKVETNVKLTLSTQIVNSFTSQMGEFSWQADSDKSKGATLILKDLELGTLYSLNGHLTDLLHLVRASTSFVVVNAAVAENLAFMINVFGNDTELYIEFFRRIKSKLRDLRNMPLEDSASNLRIVILEVKIASTERLSPAAS